MIRRQRKAKVSEGMITRSSLSHFPKSRKGVMASMIRYW